MPAHIKLISGLPHEVEAAVNAYLARLGHHPIKGTGERREATLFPAHIGSVTHTATWSPSNGCWVVAMIVYRAETACE